jgi:hypothetical protein
VISSSQILLLLLLLIIIIIIVIIIIITVTTVTTVIIIIIITGPKYMHWKSRPYVLWLKLLVNSDTAFNHRRRQELFSGEGGRKFDNKFTVMPIKAIFTDQPEVSRIKM